MERPSADQGKVIARSPLPLRHPGHPPLRQRPEFFCFGPRTRGWISPSPMVGLLDVKKSRAVR